MLKKIIYSTIWFQIRAELLKYPSQGWTSLNISLTVLQIGETICFCHTSKYFAPACVFYVENISIISFPNISTHQEICCPYLSFPDASERA